MKSQHQVIEADTAYIISLPYLDQVISEPFVSAGGEILKVGDRIIGTDNGKGSAGNQAIKMADGWYQKYIGKIKLDHNQKDTTFILFQAYHISTAVNATADMPLRFKHNMIGYVELSGSLFHWRGNSSNNVVPCKTIQRL